MQTMLLKPKHIMVRDETWVPDLVFARRHWENQTDMFIDPGNWVYSRMFKEVWGSFPCLAFNYNNEKLGDVLEACFSLYIDPAPFECVLSVAEIVWFLSRGMEMVSKLAAHRIWLEAVAGYPLQTAQELSIVRLDQMD